MFNLLKAFCVSLLLMCSTTAIASDLSGAWYDPTQPGWGLAIDDGADATFYALFTYNNELASDVEQAWFVGVDSTGTREEIPFNRPLAIFPAEGWEEAAPTMVVSVEEVDENTMVFSWRFVGEAGCPSPSVSPRPWFCASSVTFVRLLDQPEVE